MTMHQEQNTAFSDRKNQSNQGLDLTIRLEQALMDNKRDLEEAETAFESADEEAFHASVSAEESEKAYQANHELLQALRAEEESMRNATKLAAALANDASMLKTDKDTNYSELLNQAMNALATVSTNAEQELARKQNQREEAEYADQRLRLQAAATQLSAYMATLRRAKAEYNRLHATNSLSLIENQHKLAKIRSELSSILQNIAKQRAFLDETLEAYYQAVRDAEQLSIEETQHKEKLEQLNQNLSLSSAEIIPFETLVNDLKHEENKLQEAYSKAEKAAFSANQQETRLAEAMEAANQHEQDCLQSGNQQKSELQQKNSSMLEEAERNLQSAAAALANATDLAEQSRLELEKHEAQIPLQENENLLRKEALEKARNTAGETARMVVNVQAIKSAMRGSPASSLSSAEVVLQNTLQTTNDMVEEKQQAYNESKRLLEEMKETNRFLHQAAEEAEQAKNALQVIYNGVNDDYQRIVEQIRRTEAQLLTATDKELNEARLHRLSVSESWEAAKKKASAKRKTAEELQQQLEEVQIKCNEAVQSRDQMQKQINELNARIELEKMQTTANREHRIIYLWEESKNLHLRAKETGLQLKRDIENAQKLSHQEQRLGLSLLRIVQQANEEISSLYTRNSHKLGNSEEMVNELKTALDSYRKNPRLRQNGYDETLYTASKLLTNSELSNLDTLAEPIPYQIEIGEYIKLDPELILKPIPQVEGDAEIKLEPIDIEKLVKEKETRIEALFSTEKRSALETISAEEKFDPETKAMEETQEPPEEEDSAPSAPLQKRPIIRSTDSTKLLDELMALVDVTPEEIDASVEEEPAEVVEETIGDADLEQEAPLQEDAEDTQPEETAQTIASEEEPQAPAEAAAVEDEDKAAAEALPNTEENTADQEQVETPDQVEATEKEEKQKEIDAEAELSQMLLDIEALKNSIEEMEKASSKALEEEIAAASSPTAALEETKESTQLAQEIDSLRDLIQKEDQENEAKASAVEESQHPQETAETPENAENQPELPAETPQNQTAERSEEVETPSALIQEETAEEAVPEANTDPAEATQKDAPPAETSEAEKEEIPEVRPHENIPKVQQEYRSSTKFPDERVSNLANEISSLRSLLGAEEGEAFSLMGSDGESKDAEYRARLESERLRKEEEEAQRKAEELAAAKAAEEQKAAAEESARLTRLAEEAARSLESKQRSEAKSEISPKAVAKEENEDDLEAELRRLIFSSFK